jgi:hypothetical protein
MGLNPTLTMIEIYSDQATLYLWLYSIFSIFILINVMHYQFSPVNMVVDPPLPATLHHMGPPPHASSTWAWHPLALRPMGPSPATWTSPPCRSLDQSRHLTGTSASVSHNLIPTDHLHQAFYVWLAAVLQGRFTTSGV